MSNEEDIFNVKNTNMLYDLRSVYAINILKPILEQIEYHRSRNEYVLWFEKMYMDLHTNINQKLDDDARTEWDKLFNETIKELNKYPSTFAGHDKTPEKVFKIKMLLKKMEQWLKQKMESEGLYGKGFEYDPDEI